MQIVIVGVNDLYLPLSVSEDVNIETVKAIIEADTNVSSSQMVLVYHGRLLSDTETLQEAGVGEGDILEMKQFRPVRQRTNNSTNIPMSSTGSSSSHAAAAVPAGPPKTVSEAMAILRQDPTAMAQLRARNPAMAEAVERGDAAAFDDAMKRHNEVLRAEESRRQKLAQLYAAANADPLNVDVQRQIEDMIKEQLIHENYEAAMENHPEVFFSVHMLYVPMEVNGMLVKAFVDSGAQMTIMTQRFAEKCQLSNWVDSRFQGVAKGVGSSKVIGRVHAAKMKVQGQTMLTSLTVLEQKEGPEFIFGLDMLRRHQCCIDLKRHVLTVGSLGVDIPFLSESEIPNDFFSAVGEGEGKSGSEGGGEGGKMHVEGEQGGSTGGSIRETGTSSAVDHKAETASDGKGSDEKKEKENENENENENEKEKKKKKEKENDGGNDDNSTNKRKESNTASSPSSNTNNNPVDENKVARSSTQDSGSNRTDTNNVSNTNTNITNTSNIRNNNERNRVVASSDAAEDEKVHRLMQLGFNYQTSLMALRSAGGSEELAAALLFG